MRESPKFVQDRFAYTAQQEQPQRFWMSKPSDPNGWDDYKSALGWKVPSRHGGKLAAIAGLMEASNSLIDDMPWGKRAIRPTPLKFALPETTWRVVNKIGPVVPHAWGEPSSHDLFAMLESRHSWSSQSDLADQIAAGTSPLQLIVAPGGGPSRI